MTAIWRWPRSDEVVDGEFGGAAMVEHDVGDPLMPVGAGDGDGGQGRVALQRGVDGDDAIDGAFERAWPATARLALARWWCEMRK